ncbi:CheR family methyltransferase [Cellulomonas telluris]|uniref:CheR family methyltransferase n=1 Tax=Cellulomonas telluris TaxID=2306636 RepID=UPI001CA4166A|nr:protein-glutamate O-methyltransferase CheR [Cellulomonas telluris]
MSIARHTFAYVAEHVRRTSAIQLDDGKEYLVESRLMPLAREAGLPDVDAYVARLRAEPGSAAHDDVVEALTTNETSWFRDVAPFEALRRHILPEIAERAGARRAPRIWSAACSTGQEPWSIAMVLEETLGPDVRAEVLATDLSTQVLERARTGEYSQLEVNRGLPAAMLVRHLERHGMHWRVGDALRRTVTFRRHNLLDTPPSGGFDVVFLRNVLIYFDLPTRHAVLEHVRTALRPDGWLVLGSAETTSGVHDGFERVQVGSTVAFRATAATRPGPLVPPPPAGRSAPLAAVPHPAAPALAETLSLLRDAAPTPTPTRGAGLT